MQETSKRHTPNYEYENFVLTHIEIATECIPTKPRTKCRVPLEGIVLREKRNNTNITSLEETHHCPET